MPWTCTYCGKTYNTAQWDHRCPKRPTFGKQSSSVPPELQAALDEDISLRMMYGRLTGAQRKKLHETITESEPRMRKRRATQVIKQLAEGKLEK